MIAELAYRLSQPESFSSSSQRALPPSRAGPVPPGLTPIPSPRGEGSSYYYSLDGRKLSDKPTQKGVYINNGQKVVIK